jgi:hypothetical protein
VFDLNVRVAADRAPSLADRVRAYAGEINR